MVFSLTVSTPKNTVITKSQSTPLKMFKGLIYHVEIYFPPGSSGLLGIQLEAGGHQLYPYNRGSWFVGDNILFKYDDLMIFDISTAQLDIVTYNLDTILAHKVLINIGLMTDERFIEAVAPTVSMSTLVSAIDKLTSVITSSLPSGKKPIGAFLSKFTGKG